MLTHERTIRTFDIKIYRDLTSFHLSSPKSLYFNFVDYPHARLFNAENPRLFDFIETETDEIRLPEQDLVQTRGRGGVGYDPYKADVYVLGILYKKKLTSVRIIPYTHPIPSGSLQFSQDLRQHRENTQTPH